MIVLFSESRFKEHRKQWEDKRERERTLNSNLLPLQVSHFECSHKEKLSIAQREREQESDEIQ
jgi:hypothetical protein